MSLKVFLSPMLKEKEKTECIATLQRYYPGVTYADKISEANLRIAAKDEISFIIKASTKIITPLSLSQMCVYRVNPFENDIPVKRIVNLFLYGSILVFVDCDSEKMKALTRKILSMGGVVENIINFNGDQKDENTYFLYGRPLTQAEIKADRKNVHTDWIDTLYVSDCNISYENYQSKAKRTTTNKNVSVRSATKAASKDKNGILKYRISMNQPDILTAFRSAPEQELEITKESSPKKLTTKSIPKSDSKKQNPAKQKSKNSNEPISVFRLPNTDTHQIDQFLSTPFRHPHIPSNKVSPPVANIKSVHPDPSQTIGFISISDSSSSDEDIEEVLQKNSFEAITARVSQQTSQSNSSKYSTPRRQTEPIDLTQTSDLSDGEEVNEEKQLPATFSPVYKSPLQSPKRNKPLTQNTDDKLKQLVSSLLTIHPVDKPNIQQHKYATSSTVSDITQFTQVSDFSQSQNEVITYESESRSASQLENVSPNHDPLLQALSSFV